MRWSNDLWIICESPVLFRIEHNKGLVSSAVSGCWGFEDLLGEDGMAAKAGDPLSLVYSQARL
jgi:hypothetical protein